MQIAISELQQMLTNLDRPLIATLAVETEVKIPKKHSLGRVSKRSIVNGVIGSWDYGTAVNRAILKDANPQSVEELKQVPVFTPGERRWGRRIPKSALVEHRDQYYLEIKVERSLKTEWFINGREATPQEVGLIKSCLPASSDSPVTLRDYRLDSIREIKVNGEVYLING